MVSDAQGCASRGILCAPSRGAINVLRATKLVYLSDRRSMNERDRPITGDDFVSMPFGPVNTYTYSYMNGEAADRRDQWSEFIAPRRNLLISLASTSISRDLLDELSRADTRMLDATWKEFNDIDRFELAEWTHKFCPEWRDPHGSSLPLHFATVFKKLEKPDPHELNDEIQAERALSLEFLAKV